MAFPLRILIRTELENDGRFHELVLDLPYREDALGPCKKLELFILDGRVVDAQNFEVLGEYCAE